MKVISDLHTFSMQLASAHRAWPDAKESLFSLVEHWRSIRYLESIVQIDKVQGRDVIAGNFLGKDFVIQLTPLLKNGKFYAEAVVRVSTVSASFIEADRFLINRNGTIFSTEEVELMHCVMDSEKILASIISSVAEHPASKDSL